MIGPTWTRWRTRLLLTGSAAALAFTALATAAPPAQARVWVSVGVPCCGYYPGPYYGYPPPPYAYAPPPGYYPPPGAYPPGAYPPPPDGAAPSAYAPGQPVPGYAPGQPAPGYAPPAGAAPSAAATPGAPGTAGITYTNKPAFTNAAGQTCREYKAADMTTTGTACRQADGQWRVVN